MYRSIKSSLSLCAALALCLAWACSPSGGAAPGDAAVASVTISFPTLSRVLLDAAAGGSGARSLSSSRPFFCASRVVVRLLDSGGALADSVSLEPDSQYGDTLNARFAVEPGSYRVEAYIYNFHTSESSPVASGSSEGFTVAAGGTASVSFPCLPVDPVELSPGAESQSLDLTPFVFTLYPTMTEFREERWFSYLATGPSIIAATPRDPERRGYFLAVYDAQGILLGSLDGGAALSPDGSGALALALNQGERYFIGCISYGQSVEELPTVNPSVFTVSARPDLFASLSLSDASGTVIEESFDPRNYAAVLCGGTKLSVTAVGWIPGSSLSVDGSPASFGSPASLRIGEGKAYVDIAATDPQDRSDARRVWIVRATPLTPGLRTAGTSQRGEDIFFYMPIQPDTAYAMEWTRMGDSGSEGFTMYAAVWAFDEDGREYVTDQDYPMSSGFTSGEGASCLMVRAQTRMPGYGGRLGLTVSAE